MVKITNNKIYIVMYHYIRDLKKSDHPNLKALELTEFKKQINFFIKNFNVLNYFDFLEILQSKKIPSKPSVLLTFDDGYSDHFNNVFPFLLKKNVSGIFYTPIITLKNRKVLDVNKVHFILEKEFNREKIIKFINENLKKYLNKDLQQINIDRINLFNRWDDKETTLIKRLLQDLLPQKIRTKILNKLFENIMSETETDFSKKLYLNKKNINEMKNNKMFFGVHGFNHKRLARLNFDEQNNEISKSIKEFKKLKFKVENLSICYPYGSYNKTTIKLIKKYNLNFGLTLKVGPINKRNISNIYELPRYDCNDFLNL